MDTVMVPYSSMDHRSMISPYKQIKTPRKSPRAFNSNTSENLVPTNILYGGSLLHHYHHHLPSPPPPSSSLPSSYPLSVSIFSHPFRQQYHRRHQQPPLLPLPAPVITHQSLPSGAGGLISCPPSTRKTNKRRDQSLAPKKPKPSKREDPKQDLTKTKRAISECLIISSTKQLGPDPNDLPRDVSRVLGKTPGTVAVEELEEFSGTVFSLAPPPSSLPLPKFSLRPKLCCNAEAAGIDAGATDSLRRLLRLR